MELRSDQHAARAAEFRAFWQAWEAIFGPPALESIRGRPAMRDPGGQLRLPDAGQRVVVGGLRGLVVKVFRTAAALEADGGSPPYGWRLRVLLKGGRVLTCKPQSVRCP